MQFVRAALPLVIGFAAHAQIAFEVASIRPAAPVEAGRTSISRSV
jgi:hypothetical protein